MYKKYIIIDDMNNINLDDLVLGNIYIHGEPIMGQNRIPIVAGYIGNYVDHRVLSHRVLSANALRPKSLHANALRPKSLHANERIRAGLYAGRCV